MITVSENRSYFGQKALIRPLMQCVPVARRGESGVTSDDGDPARGL